MSADIKKQELRSLLASKSTEELEKLLIMDFAEDQGVLGDEYISTILEVIEEREKSEEYRKRETQNAWNEFRTYCIQAEAQEKLEADNDEKLNLDHQHKTEYCQKSRKRTSVWRIGVIAAAMVVLLCGTAFGWNLFQVIADWTEDVLYFLTGHERTEDWNTDVFILLNNYVERYTDVPVVPRWAPEGTQELEALSINERNNRCAVGQGYIIGERMFSIRIIVYPTMHDSQLNIYQKDATVCEEYVVNGITHYIVGNNDNLSAMWINGSVEGHIQGDLTLEELRLMIDSIYQE